MQAPATGSVFDAPPPPPAPPAPPAPPVPADATAQVASVFDAPPAAEPDTVASVFDAPPAPRANVSPDHPAMGGRDDRDVVIDLTTERGARVQKRHLDDAATNEPAADADDAEPESGPERPRRRFEFFGND